MHTRKHAHTYARMHACTSMYTHARMYKHVQACTRMHACTRTHACTHTHAHTHTHYKEGSALVHHTTHMYTLGHAMYVLFYDFTHSSQSHECTWPPPTQHQQLILTTRFIPVCSPHSLDSNRVQCRALIPSHCLHIPMQLQSTASGASHKV